LPNQTHQRRTHAARTASCFSFCSRNTGVARQQARLSPALQECHRAAGERRSCTKPDLEPRAEAGDDTQATARTRAAATPTDQTEQPRNDHPWYDHERHCLVYARPTSPLLAKHSETPWISLLESPGQPTPPQWPRSASAALRQALCGEPSLRCPTRSTLTTGTPESAPPGQPQRPLQTFLIDAAQLRGMRGSALCRQYCQKPHQHRRHNHYFFVIYISRHRHDRMSARTNGHTSQSNAINRSAPEPFPSHGHFG